MKEISKQDILAFRKLATNIIKDARLKRGQVIDFKNFSFSIGEKEPLYYYFHFRDTARTKLKLSIGSQEADSFGPAIMLDQGLGSKVVAITTPSAEESILEFQQNFLPKTSAGTLCAQIKKEFREFFPKAKPEAAKLDEDWKVVGNGIKQKTIKIESLVKPDGKYSKSLVKVVDELHPSTKKEIYLKHIKASQSLIAGSDEFPIKIYKSTEVLDFRKILQQKVVDHAINKKGQKKDYITNSYILWKENERQDKSEMLFQTNFASYHYGGGTFVISHNAQEEMKGIVSPTTLYLLAGYRDCDPDLDLAVRGGTHYKQAQPTVILNQITTLQLKKGASAIIHEGTKAPEMAVEAMDAPSRFNELAIAANSIGGPNMDKWGNDNQESVTELFINSYAGFNLAKKTAQAEGKSCKIETGLFGAGCFKNAAEFSIATQYLAARMLDVNIEFRGIEPAHHKTVEAICDEVDILIAQNLSVSQIIDHALQTWKTSIIPNPDINSAWRRDVAIAHEIVEIKDISGRMPALAKAATPSFFPPLRAASSDSHAAASAAPKPRTQPRDEAYTLFPNVRGASQAKK